MDNHPILDFVSYMTLWKCYCLSVSSDIASAHHIGVKVLSLKLKKN